MAAQERLSAAKVSEHTLIVCEHKHRYHLAANICRDLRVLDLACGVGYGTGILIDVAAAAHGIDIDEATVDLATATVGRRTAATFAVGDAVDVLAQDLSGSYDAIVCFEGLEHLADLQGAVRGLRQQAERGVQLLLSIPNSRMFDEDNEFHVTAFGYSEMADLVNGFSDAIVLRQYLAEGSVILGDDGNQCEAVLEHLERAEPEYANHFLVLVNVAAEATMTYRSRVHVEHAPVYNRYVRGLERAHTELHHRNNELARKMLGGQRGSGARASSGAAGFVGGLERRAAELEAELVQQDSTIFALRRELRELRQRMMSDDAAN